MLVFSFVKSSSSRMRAYCPSKVFSMPGVAFAASMKRRRSFSMIVLTFGRRILTTTSSPAGCSSVTIRQRNAWPTDAAPSERTTSMDLIAPPERSTISRRCALTIVSGIGWRFDFMSLSASRMSSPNASAGSACSIFWRSGPAPLKSAPTICPAVEEASVLRKRDASICRPSCGDAFTK